MPSPVFDNQYCRLPERFYARVDPAKVPAPELIRLNEPLAASLGLDPQWLASPAGVAMLSGNVMPEGAVPIAQAYAGHQFGGWVPQLGDGRAILLGEVRHEDGGLRDLQLKGSGRTPFSRGGDGKAPLGPVLREYLVSEAMAAMGLPATRALAAVASGETVYRDKAFPGAILTRVASSHIRVGTFQFFYAREDVEGLRTLADFVIARHDAEAAHAENRYEALLRGVIRRQASLIARWMQLGFIHGVMNTDNMAVSGETIDFGPCAFMDEFHPETVFSSIDRMGRYAWINQPVAGGWNLARFAETLLPLLAEDSGDALRIAEACLGEFDEIFQRSYFGGFAGKMALPEDAETTRPFIERTLTLMAESGIDFTRFFTGLTRFCEAKGERTAVPEGIGEGAEWEQWFSQWQGLVLSDEESLQKMKRSNPVIIPRNHRVEEAIQAGLKGDFSVFHRLLDAFSDPFAERKEFADLETPPAAAQKVRETFCGT